MPDATLSDALKEAYASAPAHAPLIHTLSIWYDGLMVGGVESEIYIFIGQDGDRRDGETNVPLKDFRLEGDGRLFGGEVKEFIGIPFDITLPDVTTDETARGTLSVDGVGGEVAQLMSDAIGAGVAIECTYRAYIQGMENDGPQNIPPLQFNLNNVTADAQQVQGEITLPRVGAKKFPRQLYTLQRFPALAS